jgi:glutathione S-transferase
MRILWRLDFRELPVDEGSKLGFPKAPFWVGDHLSLAEVALAPYTRVAHEGGFDLAGYPFIRAWIARVEALRV